jgi:hypothetical protein
VPDSFISVFNLTHWFLAMGYISAGDLDGGSDKCDGIQLNSLKRREARIITPHICRDTAAKP